jgi:hypothetical protein
MLFIYGYIRVFRLYNDEECHHAYTVGWTKDDNSNTWVRYPNELRTKCACTHRISQRLYEYYPAGTRGALIERSHLSVSRTFCNVTTVSGGSFKRKQYCYDPQHELPECAYHPAHNGAQT